MGSTAIGRLVGLSRSLRLQNQSSIFRPTVWAQPMPLLVKAKTTTRRRCCHSRGGPIVPPPPPFRHQVPDSGDFLFRFNMDWQGQKLAEQLMQIMLLAFAAVAFASGYVLGSFQMMILVYAGGVVLTTLITVPNWPWYNRHPLRWLDPSEAEKHPKPQKPVISSSKKKSAKK